MVTDLGAADLPDCVALFTQTFAAPPWDETWQPEDVVARLGDLVATPGSTGVCLRDGDGTLLGFALGNRERSLGADQFFLREMCVRADRQRSGLGAQLLEGLEQRLPGVRSWVLLTARDSAPAAFYLGHGFRPAGRMGVFVRP